MSIHTGLNAVQFLIHSNELVYCNEETICICYRVTFNTQFIKALQQLNI